MRAKYLGPGETPQNRDKSSRLPCRGGMAPGQNDGARRHVDNAADTKLASSGDQGVDEAVEIVVVLVNVRTEPQPSRTMIDDDVARGAVAP